MPAAGAREITVLSEFKPFGLTVEAQDGGEPPCEDYQYFLFDSEDAKKGHGEDEFDEASAPSGDEGDQEIFIRGNKIIWSGGCRVHKRFTLPSRVIKVCWCKMGNRSEASLCVLLADSITIYGITGEMISIPLLNAIKSIWSLPFGLLLLREPEDTSLSSPSLLYARDVFRPKKDVRYSPHHCYTPPHASNSRINGAPSSSHLILKDPLEEPQITYTEERGHLSVMWDFDEATIWASDVIPLMVSHNKAKMQHSLWVIEALTSNIEETNPGLSRLVLPGIPMKHFFRRIWQVKGSQTPASKIFLAADLDGAQIICFLLHEQKKLLSLRLQSLEVNSEVVYDVKPDISWIISAISATALAVTRSKSKCGQLPVRDVIVLTPENTFLLYSGNLCLCKFVMPPNLDKGPLSQSKHSETRKSDIRVIDLVDAVEGRFNIVLKNRQIFRCVVLRGPSSSLTNDCVSSMSEGLGSNFYMHFLSCLWGDTSYLSKDSLAADSEWESFCDVIKKMCQKPCITPASSPDSDLHPSWKFILQSKYNHNYLKRNCISGAFPGLSSGSQGLDVPVAIMPSSSYGDEKFHRELLTETLDSLHAVYETLKLDKLRKRDLGLLGALLYDIASFLQEASFLDYYIRDFTGLLKDYGAPACVCAPRNPPNLMRWLENCLRLGYGSASASDIPTLICKDGASTVNLSRKIVLFYSLLCGAEQVGGKLSCGIRFNIASGIYRNREELTILAMVGEKFGLQHLDLVPAGVSLPLRHALDKCRESPPTNWPDAAYVLIGREDLAFSHLGNAARSSDLDSALTNLISMSMPYMLPLQPVSMPSCLSDTLEFESAKLDDGDTHEGSVADGMEHIFNSCTQMRFGRDMRLNEVRRLLCSARPVPIQTPTNLSASDQDIQQNQLWHLAQRTTALPFGRGAFTLGTICTFLTEAFSVPKLILAGRLPAQQNAVVNLDPNTRNVQELKCWPEFHNAVAAGLRLSPVQGKLSRTWILYNKPDEPNVTHAGLLLALGLHGHLQVLTISDIYIYYSPEHESTTVGLMIGLAASYRGTMQPSISKSLYVHLPARHPSSFPELELPTLIQSAALISIGLLYERSAHPQTMQILLSEIGRRSSGDNALEWEGYAVSAGFSLGFVALGRGEDANGSVDTLVEQLFQYIEGKELQNNSLHPFSSSSDEHNRNAGQVMDLNPVNVDVTAPAAIIAVALMYLKTESEVIVSRLKIPQTHYELQYVRPDFILLRVVARNLILWSRVYPSEEWIKSQIPEIIKDGVSCLGNEMSGIQEMDAEAFIQAYVNTITGACVSLGLRFAGTRDGSAEDLLYKYAIYFLNEVKPVCVSDGKILPSALSSYVDRGTLESCLLLIVLSLCVVMSGSGNLKILRLLKFLRNKSSSADGHAYFGSQMAVSLGIGFLFLGGGMRTFSTSNSSIAALLVTLYPRFPTGPNDNRCHLQAFRHLYVLATEPRWIQTVDVDTALPVYVPLEVTIKETQVYAETSFCEVTPCILPERAILKALRVCGPRYWPQLLEFPQGDEPWWNPGDKHHPFRSGILYVKRKVGACSYADDHIGSQSLLSRAIYKMNGLNKPKNHTPTTDSLGEAKVEQLVNTFSSNPSLVVFAQLFCDSNWTSRSELDIQTFCLKILFECVSKDRPAMLQVYLSLYAMVEGITDSVANGNRSSLDSLSVSSLKIALAYKEALSNGILTASSGEILQSAFLGSLKKRVEDTLNHCSYLSADLGAYAVTGMWPAAGDAATLLSMYLQWYGVPTAFETRQAFQKMRRSTMSSSVPLLRLVFPGTHVAAIRALHKFCLDEE